MQLGHDGGPEPDTDEAFLWAHNLQDKERNTYKGDFKMHHGYDSLENYEPQCEQYVMNDRDGVKLDLIVGLQKARMTRHSTLKVDDVTSLKAEVGQVEIKVERGKNKRKKSRTFWVERWCQSIQYCKGEPILKFVLGSA